MTTLVGPHEKELGEVEQKIADMKSRKRDLEVQRKGSFPLSAESSGGDEGLLERIMGRFYQAPAISQPTGPTLHEVEAELAVVDEGLQHLREIREVTKSAAAKERAETIMPRYLEAVEALRSAIDEAVERNEFVRNIERQFLTPRPYSLSWDVLGLLGWSYGTNLRDWRAKVGSFLKRNQP